jgi:FlaA1/EpsC-like NDP-sugar epimerase
MVGGEIYVKKIPSMKVVDLARVIAPNAKHEIIGIRPGEKLHEQMIGIEDAPFTFDYEQYYKILPQINGWNLTKERIKDGVKVADDFIYTSDLNPNWMMPSELLEWMRVNQNKIGKI